MKTLWECAVCDSEFETPVLVVGELAHCPSCGVSERDPGPNGNGALDLIDVVGEGTPACARWL